ncbi:MAG: hypothetical protein ACTSXW_01075 [Candidatus Baldrarchaeia archaeon]
MVEATWYCMQCGQHNTIEFESLPSAPRFHYLKSVCGECGADIYVLAWKCPNCQETYRIVSNFDFLSAIVRSVQSFLNVNENISIKLLRQRCVKCGKTYQLILEDIIAF